MGNIGRKKIIQVPIDDELLKRIDATSGLVAESRAQFIRTSCKLRLRNLEEEALDVQYVAGYRRKPDTTKWSEAAAKLLARSLAKEKW